MSTLHPFMARRGDDAIFMHDNSRPHTARVAQDYLNDVGMHPMMWPARSPDLNPIEHAWDKLGRRVRQRDSPAITFPELKRALVEEWENIPQQCFRNMVHSMPNRIAAVQKAHGGNIKY